MSTTNLDDKFSATPPPPPVKITRADILAALKFGPQVERPTKFGPRLVSTAKPSPEFFDLYKADPTVRAEGYTLGRWPKDTGPWITSYLWRAAARTRREMSLPVAPLVTFLKALNCWPQVEYAELSTWNNACALARKIALKYRRQLPDSLIEGMTG